MFDIWNASSIGRYDYKVQARTIEAKWLMLGVAADAR